MGTMMNRLAVASQANISVVPGNDGLPGALGALPTTRGDYLVQYSNVNSTGVPACVTEGQGTGWPVGR
jgi:hypothetical protein